MASGLFGALRAKPPPCYIATIEPPFIRLEALDRQRRADLIRGGLELTRDEGGRHAVRFAAHMGDTLSNPHLAAVLEALSEAGVLFGEDYKLGWAPADIMRDLQERGLVRCAFTAIGWTGPGAWITRVYEPGSSRAG